jgi:hypothetical protein
MEDKDILKDNKWIDGNKKDRFFILLKIFDVNSESKMLDKT